MNEISVAEYFAANDYKSIVLQKLETGHLVIKASINHSPGLFILDSGAGTTVVDEKNSYKFKLQITIDSITGAGAGGSGLKVWSSENNNLAIGDFQLDSFKVSAMDLGHVTAGLKQLGVQEEIDGVIGADLLEKGNAVINYPSKQLFLKKN